MKRIIFSYPTPIENELEKVHELLTDNDVDFFHLRKPDFDRHDMKAYLNQIDEHFYNKIILHSHYGLISKYDVAGINLNKKAMRDMAIADEVDRCYIQPLVLNNRQIEINRVQPNMVTYSAHSFDEINNLSFDTEYVFLSPIYDSISKEGYKSNFDLNELECDLKNVNTKIIALGGVTLSKIDDLMAIGFNGYARLGDFWRGRSE